MSEELKVTYTDDFKSKYKVEKIELKSAKEQIIDTLSNILDARFRYVADDKRLTRIEKLEKEEVIYSVMKFLQNYDENVKALDKIEREKAYKEKFKADKPAPYTAKGKYNRARQKEENQKIIGDE